MRTCTYLVNLNLIMLQFNLLIFRCHKCNKICVHYRNWRNFIKIIKHGILDIHIRWYTGCTDLEGSLYSINVSFLSNLGIFYINNHYFTLITVCT